MSMHASKQFYIYVCIQFFSNRTLTLYVGIYMIKPNKAAVEDMNIDQPAADEVDKSDDAEIRRIRIVNFLRHMKPIMFRQLCCFLSYFLSFKF